MSLHHVSDRMETREEWDIFEASKIIQEFEATWGFDIKPHPRLIIEYRTIS